ncbi:hypothetical protein V9T40_008815 [Parthenolecanium corni]|uniref:Uncharacterized protein n=1 Tax=Parthenolecanium corni TaxID=536013 RepID=A0AAN9TLK2_9HEMI
MDLCMNKLCEEWRQLNNQISAIQDQELPVIRLERVSLPATNVPVEEEASSTPWSPLTTSPPATPLPSTPPATPSPASTIAVTPPPAAPRRSPQPTSPLSPVSSSASASPPQPFELDTTPPCTPPVTLPVTPPPIAPHSPNVSGDVILSPPSSSFTPIPQPLPTPPQPLPPSVKPLPSQKFIPPVLLHSSVEPPASDQRTLDALWMVASLRKRQDIDVENHGPQAPRYNRGERRAFQPLYDSTLTPGPSSTQSIQHRLPVFEPFSSLLEVDSVSAIRGSSADTTPADLTSSQQYATFNSSHQGFNELVLGSSPEFFHEMNMYSDYAESGVEYTLVHTDSNDDDFFDASGNSFKFLRSMIDSGYETDTDYPIQY